MRYILQKIKKKTTGEIYESVLLYSGTDKYPAEVMLGEELLDSKEITEQEAIKMCGREAILGEEQPNERNI